MRTTWCCQCPPWPRRPSAPSSHSPERVLPSWPGITTHQGYRYADPAKTGPSGSRPATRVRLMIDKVTILYTRAKIQTLYPFTCLSKSWLLSRCSVPCTFRSITVLYLWSCSRVRLPPLSSLGDSRSGMILGCWRTTDCTHRGFCTRQYLNSSFHLPSACTQLNSDNATQQPQISGWPSTLVWLHNWLCKDANDYVKSFV